MDKPLAQVTRLGTRVGRRIDQNDTSNPVMIRRIRQGHGCRRTTGNDHKVRQIEGGHNRRKIAFARPDAVVPIASGL